MPWENLRSGALATRARVRARLGQELTVIRGQQSYLFLFTPHVCHAFGVSHYCLASYWCYWRVPMGRLSGCMRARKIVRRVEG